MNPLIFLFYSLVKISAMVTLGFILQEGMWSTCSSLRSHRIRRPDRYFNFAKYLVCFEATDLFIINGILFSIVFSLTIMYVYMLVSMIDFYYIYIVFNFVFVTSRLVSTKKVLSLLVSLAVQVFSLASKIFSCDTSKLLAELTSRVSVSNETY